MDWKIGDIAIATCSCNGRPDSECEIVGGDRFMFEIKTHLGDFLCPPQKLRPLPPPNIASSWERCIWRPTKEIA